MRNVGLCTKKWSLSGDELFYICKASFQKHPIRTLEINQGDTIEVFLEKGNQRDENELLRMATSHRKRKLVELEEENVDIRGKNALLLTAKEEACKQRRLLEDTLKCPVCFQLPKELPVLCCPNGHIVCSPCNEQMKKRGNLNCSTCKVPMEGGRSLVAQNLIENMDHACGFNGCGEMVHFKKYKDHQRSCDRRPVCCPGRAPCNTVLPFQEIKDHVLKCRTMKMVDSGLMFTVEDEVGHLGDDGSWKTRIIRGTLNTEDDEKNWKLFFFRMEKKGDFYHSEVVMLGSEEECNKLTVVVSILDKEGVKEVVGFFCNPRFRAAKTQPEFRLILEYFDNEYKILIFTAKLRNRVFHKKKWLNSLCKYLGATLEKSKRIFDVDKFSLCTTQTISVLAIFTL